MKCRVAGALPGTKISKRLVAPDFFGNAEGAESDSGSGGLRSETTTSLNVKAPDAVMISNLETKSAVAKHNRVALFDHPADTDQAGIPG